MAVPILDNSVLVGRISGFNISTSFNQGSATGDFSFAVGSGRAYGLLSHAEGSNTTASGSYSHAEGNNTTASGQISHAEGNNTTASGPYSHAEGDITRASGTASHAEGQSTNATGHASHSEGINTRAIGGYSHAAGINTVAGLNSWVWRGPSTLTLQVAPVSSTRTGQFIVSAGGGIYFPGNVGIGTDNNENSLTVVGDISGFNLRTSFNQGSAIGDFSFAEGAGRAYGIRSHAEGLNTRAIGNSSHAEGEGSVASSSASHAEGLNTTASGQFSHAEGRTTVAGGTYAHAEGFNTTALGGFSHSEGFQTRATAQGTHAAGRYIEVPFTNSWGWRGSTSTSYLSTTRTEQFNVFADNGVVLRSSVGINTDDNTNALTVVGTISTNNHRSSKEWSDTYNFVQTNSATILPTTNNITINSDMDTNLLGGIIGGLTYRKSDTFFDYTYLDFNAKAFAISGSGDGYSGTFNLSILTPANNNFIIFENIRNFIGTISILSSLNALLTSISFPTLRAVSNDFVIYIPQSLRAINLPSLEYIGGYFSNSSSSFATNSLTNEDISEIYLPELQYVGGAIAIGGYGNTKAPILSSIFFPKLKVCRDIIIGGSTGGAGVAGFRNLHNLQNINLSALEIINGSLNFSAIVSLTSYTFGNLKAVKSNTSFQSCTALREVSFPNLVVIGGYSSAFSNTNTPSLTSMSFPNIQIVSNTGLSQFGSTASLRNFEFGTNTLKTVIPNTFNVNQTLTQQSVDNLLYAFSRLDGTNGTSVFGPNRTLEVAGSNAAPSYTGGVTTSSAGTNFVRTGSTVVASVASHGHTTGDIVTFTGNGQTALNGTYIVTVNNLNEFQYTTPTSGNITGSGTVTMRRTTVATDGFRYFQIIALRGATVSITAPSP